VKKKPVARRGSEERIDLRTALKRVHETRFGEKENFARKLRNEKRKELNETRRGVG